MAKDDMQARAELRETPEKKAPAGLRAGLVTTPDGVTLRHAFARPEGHARGTVMILQGRADYIERHYELMAELLARGFAVLAFDWRGQGLSERLLRNRLKGHVRSFADYEADLEAVVRQVMFPDLPPPYYAIGISMGGHVLLKASWKHVWFERGMLISPMVGLKARDHSEGYWRKWIATARMSGMARGFFPKVRKKLITARDFPGNPLTSDEERFGREARFLAMHPEVGVAGPTVGWVHAALSSIDAFNAMVEAGGEPRWPMLALAARRDELVDPEATRRLALKVGGLSLTFLHQARHDITMERDSIRRLFLAALDEVLGGALEHAA